MRQTLYLVLAAIIFMSCKTQMEPKIQTGRVFETSFEAVSEFDGFYIVAQGDYDSDLWTRTILVNVAPDGLLRLVHVPDQGQQEYIYQNTALEYPFREWVKIAIYLDLSEHGGYAKVWQNGTLVSHAQVQGGSGLLEQAHFGLYAAAAVGSGTIYNDRLSIREIDNEALAMQYIE